MQRTVRPHPGISSDRKLTTLARHINKFGFIPGSKIFFSNYFGKTDLVHIKIPGLEHDLILRNGSSDAYCFNQVFLDLDYDFEVEIKPSFIVDCGANIGLSFLFSHKKYPKATIVAVEPEASNFEMLQKNTA